VHREIIENPEAKVTADVFERIRQAENLLKSIFAEGPIRAMIDVE
jgi:hypothetical protein